MTTGCDACMFLRYIAVVMFGNTVVLILKHGKRLWLPCDCSMWPLGLRVSLVVLFFTGGNCVGSRERLTCYAGFGVVDLGSSRKWRAWKVDVLFGG